MMETETIGRAFTMSDQANREFLPGYYWIRRCEPDGPPFWEVARFDGTVWWTAGSGYSKLPTRNPSASNAWKIGERVLPPGDVLAERERCAKIAEKCSHPDGFGCKGNGRCGCHDVAELIRGGE